MVAGLLLPMGVRTFDAADASEAMTLARLHAMHLLVVDAALSGGVDMGLWGLIGALKRRGQAGGDPVKFATSLPGLSQTLFAMPADGVDGPPVILLTEKGGDAVLREALRRNVFSVLPQPIDCQMLLDAMARALRRYHDGHWPAAGDDKANA